MDFHAIALTVPGGTIDIELLAPDADEARGLALIAHGDAEDSKAATRSIARCAVEDGCIAVTVALSGDPLGDAARFLAVAEGVFTLRGVNEMLPVGARIVFASVGDTVQAVVDAAGSRRPSALVLVLPGDAECIASDDLPPVFVLEKTSRLAGNPAVGTAFGLGRPALAIDEEARLLPRAFSLALGMA